MNKPSKTKKSKSPKYTLTGNNWKKVLLEIYNHSPHNYGAPYKIGFHDDTHPIAKKLKISGYELDMSIYFLTSHKLIEDLTLLTSNDNKQIDPNKSSNISLTDKGLEIAIKIENEFVNKKIQKILMGFTGIIASTGIVGFLQSFFGKNLFLILAYTLIVLLFLIPLYFDEIINKIRRRFLQFN